MSKRPMVIIGVLFLAVLFIAGQVGVPFAGKAPPVFPEGINENTTLQGMVYQTDAGEFYTNLFIKQVNAVQQKIPLENVIVKIKTEKLKEIPVPGMKIAVKGKLLQIPKAANPGGFDERSYYYARGVRWYFEAEKLAGVSKEAAAKSLYTQWKVREFFGKRLSKMIPKRYAGLYQAMLLGDKSELEKSDKSYLKTASASHLIAISGIHLSILGWGIYKILRKICIPVPGAAIISAILMFMYGNFTGNASSAMRAVLMFAVACGARIFLRTYDFLSALSLAAILLLLQTPARLYDSGFLLSFSAILGIALILPVIEDALDIKNKILKGLAATVAVWIATLPVMLWFFYEISIWGNLVNLLAVPAAGIIISFGMIGMLAGAVHPTAGKIFMLPGCFALGTLLKIGELIEAYLPAMWIAGRPEGYLIVLYYALLFGAGVLLAGNKKKKIAVSLAAAAVILLLFPLPDGKLHMTFLDVGQGDGIFVRTEKGHCYLVDGGSSSESKVGEYQILPYLKYEGVREVEGIFLSHMDGDHINGIEELFQLIYEKKTTLKIKNLFLSECADESSVEKQKELRELAKLCGCKVHCIYAGDRVKDGKTIISCLHPESADILNANESSQVLEISYNETQILLTGDLEGAEEERLQKILEKRKEEKQITYEILKVAHHGSKNSTQELFLETVNPAGAVISCGEGNRYGHPHEETLEKLKQQEIPVWITMENGAVEVESDGKKCVVK